MAVRKIIRIDEEKCDGCGDCAKACAEGAIAIIDGKAKLISETYCDGLGACLGECPHGAITIEEREASDFSEEAVAKHLNVQNVIKHQAPSHTPSGCPGSAMRQFQPLQHPTTHDISVSSTSQLSHWPVQLKLVSPLSPFLRNADILICADCVPFAVSDFHDRYLKGKAVLVGCPKLDDLNFYFEKLKTIFKEGNPKSITVVKMEVPCCNGIAQASIQARNEFAPNIPLEIVTIGIRGDLINRQLHKQTA